jgi:hypothetical protein
MSAALSFAVRNARGYIDISEVTWSLRCTSGQTDIEQSSSEFSESTDTSTGLALHGHAGLLRRQTKPQLNSLVHLNQPSVYGTVRSLIGLEARYTSGH